MTNTDTTKAWAENPALGETDYNAYKADDLRRLPTQAVGQADDLKIDSGLHRVWLSRMTVEDGAEFDDGVSVEVKDWNGRWTTVAEYAG